MVSSVTGMTGPRGDVSVKRTAMFAIFGFDFSSTRIHDRRLSLIRDAWKDHIEACDWLVSRKNGIGQNSSDHSASLSLDEDPVAATAKIVPSSCSWTVGSCVNYEADI